MKAAFIIGSSLLLVAGCASDNLHESDRGLEGTLRAEVNQREVHLDVHHGIVKLEGKVRTEADRQRIDSLVRNTSGVVAVKDNLKVTLPSPGIYGAYPSGIPVHVGPGPDLPPTGPVATLPPPVVIPDYPKLKLQAWTGADEVVANAIARQLTPDAVPRSRLENVTITVRNGAVYLQGTIDTHEERDALIYAVQRAGGMNAIYDQLQVQ
ncbi:MAG TPA: BON domain-containing protein [Verrucomicrobiae bacterium]|nr:BON domain-containing protein [Verrucomicrobiae bacterium]